MLPVIQEAAGFTRPPTCFTKSFVGYYAVRFEVEALQPGSPLYTAVILHLDAAAKLLLRGQVLSWSSLVLGEVDNPALQFTVISGQEIPGSIRSSSPLQCLATA